MSQFREFWVPESMIFNSASEALNKNMGAAVRLADHTSCEELANPTSAFYKERNLLREQNEKLKKEIESTSLAFEEVKRVVESKIISFRDNIYKLTAALKVAEDALGATWPNMFNEMRQHHKEALADIQKIKKGLG